MTVGPPSWPFSIIGSMSIVAVVARVALGIVGVTRLVTTVSRSGAWDDGRRLFPGYAKCWRRGGMFWDGREADDCFLKLEMECTVYGRLPQVPRYLRHSPSAIGPTFSLSISLNFVQRFLTRASVATQAPPSLEFSQSCAIQASDTMVGDRHIQYQNDWRDTDPSLENKNTFEIRHSAGGV